MATNKILMVDFETGSLFGYRNGKKTPPQPIQLAACAIDLDTLSFTKNDIWSSYMRPIFDDDEAIAFGVEPLQDKALEINHTTREMLKSAPDTKVAWTKFCEFVKRYGKGGPYTRPISSGFNSSSFDDKIIEALCGSPYNFGPCEKNGDPALFHRRDSIDLQRLMVPVVGHFPEQTSLSFDSMRTLFGFPRVEQEHNAVVDVIQQSALLCRVMQYLRKVCTPSKFNGSFSDFRVEDYLV